MWSGPALERPGAFCFGNSSRLKSSLCARGIDSSEYVLLKSVDVLMGERLSLQ